MRLVEKWMLLIVAIVYGVWALQAVKLNRIDQRRCPYCLSTPDQECVDTCPSRCCQTCGGLRVVEDPDNTWVDPNGHTQFGAKKCPECSATGLETRP